MTVRPGRSYIVLMADSSLPTLNDCPAVDVECGGVTALRLDLPESFTDEWLPGLQAFGINSSQTLEVWPAGLTAASWDGEGRAEWLTSDEVCLGIRADYPIEDITIAVEGDGSPLIVKPSVSGDTTFVDLGHLPVGRRELRIVARSRKDDESIESTGYLDLTVREPRAWIPGVIPQGPLMVFLDPSSPTLEDLWEGRLSMEIHGPAKRLIQCRVTLSDRNALAPRISKILPSIPLPVGREAWEQQIDRFRSDKRVRAAYDFSQYCVVSLSAAELGDFSFKAEREFTPLRWAVSRTDRSHRLTLLDDRGVDDAVAVYGFKLPDESTLLASLSGPFVADEGGGMYVARSRDTTRAIIVPPIVTRLEDLGVHPHVRSRRRRSLDDLYSALSNVWLWSDARLTGEILAAATRRRAVLSFLVAEMFSLIGGETWEHAEASLRRSAGPGTLRELKRAISNKPQEAGLGARLLIEYKDHVSLGARARAVRLGTLITEFLDLPVRPRGGRQSAEPTSQSADPAWLSELALRLASCSRGTDSWAGHDVRQGLSSLLACPAIARAARFLVLAIDASCEPTAIAGGDPYQGWEWD